MRKSNGKYLAVERGVCQLSIMRKDKGLNGGLDRLTIPRSAAVLRYVQG